MTIGNRLDVYGPSICWCGNRKETVFSGRYQLSCRNHPGHPLYNERGKHEARPAHRGNLEGNPSETDITDTGLASLRG